MVKYDPESAFELALLGSRHKPILAIDLHAERACQNRLYRRFSGKLEVIGEEKLRDPNLDLSRESRLIALIDMVDGTDLLKRGLSNWCSALIFYRPKKKEIEAAFVGLPTEGIYYATKKSPALFQPNGRKKPRRLKGPSSVSRWEDASVCFYGQKAKNFLSCAGNQKLIKDLKEIRKKEKESGKETIFRIYNFGGNPMMVKLADGFVDAVFDFEGQAPHDVAPGAYIAQKAGAIFRDLKGQPISLPNVLLKPAADDSRLRYILSSTTGLFRAFQKIIKQN